MHTLILGKGQSVITPVLGLEEGFAFPREAFGIFMGLRN